MLDIKKHEIKKVVKNSIADKLGVEKGDFLISINDQNIIDRFDYEYQIRNENIEVLIEKKDEQWILDVEKDFDQDLGLIFENYLMDERKSCNNKCVFCFIDQLAPNMRKTVYFKDDDYRLSYLHGNYITLTNLKDEDVQRIIKYNLSPINISIHATDESVRKKMLNNKFAGDVLKYIDELYKNNIKMNMQIVLCKGLNDGDVLEKTIKDLTKYLPEVKSLSIVPVGLSKFRDNLYKLEPFNKKDAKELIDLVSKWQKEIKNKYGYNYIYAADEFYVKADIEVPKASEYDNFPQIENGVGMLSKFENEFELFYEEISSKEVDKRTVSIATGKIAKKFVEKLANKIEMKIKGLNINVYAIENNFFGKNITVTGLITGKDLIENLKQKDLGEVLYLSESCFKSNEDIFLDDYMKKDVEKELGIKINIVKNNGKEFIKEFLESEEKNEKYSCSSRKT